jgi:hypothetical protein
VIFSPSLSLSNKTPKEDWSGRKTTIFHLRVSHCKDYMYVPKEEMKILDEKYKKCAFIIYGEIIGVNGYKLWLSNPHKSN